METLAGAKEVELTRLRTQLRSLPAATPAPPGPKKIIVDDDEPPKKTTKKKPAVHCEPFWKEDTTEHLSLFGLPSARAGLIDLWQSVHEKPFPRSTPV